MAKRIVRNRAKCDKCGDIIESTHRHQFVQCMCGSTFVDGGLCYLRRGGGAFTELSEWETIDDPKKDE